MKMKKTCVALFLFLASITIVTGCQSSKLADYESADQAVEPPCIISLYSYEEYEALRQAPQLPNEALDLHLDTNNFSMNGVSNRQELLLLLSKLDVIPFPQVSEAKILWMDYCLESGERNILFQFPDDSRMVISNLPEEFSIKKSDWTEVTSQIQPDVLQKVYQSNETCGLYLVDTDTSLFLVRFSEMNETAATSVLQKLIFEAQ